MFTLAAGEFMLVFISSQFKRSSCAAPPLFCPFFVFICRFAAALPHNLVTNHLIMRSRERTSFPFQKLRCSFPRCAHKRKDGRRWSILCSSICVGLASSNTLHTTHGWLPAVMNGKKRCSVCLYNVIGERANGAPLWKVRFYFSCTIFRQYISVIRLNFYSDLDASCVFLFYGIIRLLCTHLTLSKDMNKLSRIGAFHFSQLNAAHWWVVVAHHYQGWGLMANWIMPASLQVQQSSINMSSIHFNVDKYG